MGISHSISSKETSTATNFCFSWPYNQTNDEACTVHGRLHNISVCIRTSTVLCTDVNESKNERFCTGREEEAIGANRQQYDSMYRKGTVAKNVKNIFLTSNSVKTKGKFMYGKGPREVTRRICSRKRPT